MLVGHKGKGREEMKQTKRRQRVGEASSERCPCTTDLSTIAVCKKHGVPVHCVARRVEAADYTKFDYILAMDQSK